jgi:hypothetical protein
LRLGALPFFKLLVIKSGAHCRGIPSFLAENAAETTILNRQYAAGIVDRSVQTIFVAGERAQMDNFF